MNYQNPFWCGKTDLKRTFLTSMGTRTHEHRNLSVFPTICTQNSYDTSSLSDFYSFLSRLLWQQLSKALNWPMVEHPLKMDAANIGIFYTSFHTHVRIYSKISIAEDAYLPSINLKRKTGHQRLLRDNDQENLGKMVITSLSPWFRVYRW